LENPINQTESLSGQIAGAIAPILIFLPLLIIGLIVSRKINSEKTLQKLIQ